MAYKPIIGITTRTIYRKSADNPLSGTKPDFMAPQSHTDCILRAGGAPVLLPSITDKEYCRTILGAIHGLFIMGGDDMDPALFGEEPHPKLGAVDVQKAYFEFMLVKMAYGMDLPILGICGGHQMLNVVGGGTLYQDIPSQVPNAIKHSETLTARHPSHRIAIVPGTRIHSIHGVTELRVNSTHHQAVKDVAGDFVVAARADDGIIEAIEAPGKRFAVGVQWHPESLTPDFPVFQNIFDAFVKECTE